MKLVTRRFLNEASNGKFMNCESFFRSREDEIDNILEERYSSLFSDAWNIEFKLLESMKPFTDDEMEEIREVSRDLFKKTFFLTKDDDLSAFVYDDLELILKYIESNHDRPWMNIYASIYIENQFPYIVDSRIDFDKNRLIELIMS